MREIFLGLGANVRRLDPCRQALRPLHHRFAAGSSPLAGRIAGTTDRPLASAGLTPREKRGGHEKRSGRRRERPRGA